MRLLLEALRTSEVNGLSAGLGRERPKTRVSTHLSGFFTLVREAMVALNRNMIRGKPQIYAASVLKPAI